MRELLGHWLKEQYGVEMQGIQIKPKPERVCLHSWTAILMIAYLAGSSILWINLYDRERISNPKAGELRYGY